MGRLDIPDKYRDEDLTQGGGRAPAAARESVRLAATLEKEGRDNGTSARVRPAVPLSSLNNETRQLDVYDCVRVAEIGSEAWTREQVALGLSPEERDRV